MHSDSTPRPGHSVPLVAASGRGKADRAGGGSRTRLAGPARHRLGGLLLAIGVAGTGASVARAWNATGPAPQSTRSVGSAGQGDPVSTMKGDLRRLVSANEVYHVKNSKYAADVGALSSFRPTPGVTVTLLSASANGWAAKATAAALPGKSCVIYVGAVPTPPKTDVDGRSGPEAVAVCDKP